MTTPVAPTLVAFGGFDPSGGAGLVADAATAHALGCDVRLILCARTVQGRGHVRVWPATVSEREAVIGGLALPAAPVAVKTGAVGRIAHALAAIDCARQFAAPVVVDPVAATSSGGWLWPGLDARRWGKAMRDRVLALATVVTPNWPELALLAGGPVADLPAAERALRSLPCAAVLKGGHAPGDLVGIDFVWDGKRLVHLPRWPEWTANLRGSGCRYASALAISLACGQELVQASTQAGLHVNLAAQGLQAP